MPHPSLRVTAHGDPLAVDRAGDPGRLRSAVLLGADPRPAAGRRRPSRRRRHGPRCTQSAPRCGGSPRRRPAVTASVALESLEHRGRGAGPRLDRRAATFPAALGTASRNTEHRDDRDRNTNHGIPMARSGGRGPPTARRAGRGPRGAVDVAPAVDEERVAGEVAAVLAGEEQRDRRDVLVRVADVAHRVAGVGGSNELGMLRHHRAERRRLRRRADHVAHDPVPAHSRAAVRVAERSASLAELYSTVPMCALTPLSEQMLITRP